MPNLPPTLQTIFITMKHQTEPAMLLGLGQLLFNPTTDFETPENAIITLHPSPHVINKSQEGFRVFYRVKLNSFARAMFIYYSITELKLVIPNQQIELAH